MGRVTKNGGNILTIILIPKTDDRRTYSIVEWTQTISVSSLVCVCVCVCVCGKERERERERKVGLT